MIQLPSARASRAPISAMRGLAWGSIICRESSLLHNQVFTGVCHEQDRNYLAQTSAGRPVFPGDQSRWFHLFQRSYRPRPRHWQGSRGGIVAETERVFQNLSAVLKT